jgi:hypothetical protein
MKKILIFAVLLAILIITKASDFAVSKMTLRLPNMP